MMRTLAFLIAALVASVAQAQPTHTWQVTDNTEASTEVSSGIPRVSCGANTALRVRCSSASGWQRFSSDTDLLRLSCARTDSLHYSEAGEDDNYRSYGWPCADDNQVTKVGVSISGTLSHCEDSSLPGLTVTAGACVSDADSKGGLPGG